MARSNKYTTINFNDIFEKKSNPNLNNNNKPSSTISPLHSSHRNHGGMLVLTRPSPKPKPQSPKPLLQSPPSDHPDHHHLPHSRSEPEPNPNPSSTTISLRPLGRTGSSSLTTSSPSPLTTTIAQERPSVVSVKPEPFVPPHLRPGFVKKEEKFEQNVQRNHQGLRSREIGYGQVQYGSQSGYNENGRPKSGGGYERMRRGGESDLREVNRPSSSGNRQSSGGGWYGNGSSYRSPNQF
ncbi:hypothetical protein ACHQM5_003358 [Ranunculus cassubicifolius]